MENYESKKQGSLKTMWQETRESSSKKSLIASASPNSYSKLLGFEDNLVATVVPPVTVVLEGRSICHRISLDKHSSYQSLAKALRQMFVDDGIYNDVGNIDLSTAVPGYLIAYEDLENDLLLAGDLNWKDFVRVAKRIRILPVKAKSRKENTTT